ncbi:capsular exopolysaccharide family protein [Leptolyngbya sp. Heron Island J]|uniref:GumC family protein n=1 Tax=Leptolyngbya sp. Heron Island J TaxID=1385935 RepID=UPI0003B97C14|nr:polysaccharide biosynthesis tyrosine autokinase [Leptolyngbya sp. Heron Island J]ESA38666.1 capsular exopolysaccharide family protein [Leptolyngbya sp. Heron Island J]
MRTTQLSPSEEKSEIGYGQLLNILLRRFVWFGGAIVGTVGIAIALTLREDPVYQSSMQLLVEPNYRQTVDITNGQQQGRRSSSSQTDYATQLNLMRSKSFVEQTVEQLQGDYPEVCDPSEPLADCANSFQNALTLSQVSEGDAKTGIFKATFKGEDPEIVQSFLENLGDVYLSYNQEQQEQRLKRGLALVNQQIDSVQESLAVSRQALKDFRESENLIDPEQQSLTVADSLRQIEQSKVEVETQYLDVQAEYTALQEQLSADPQSAMIASRLSQSSRYQQLLNALQETELALEQRRSLYAEADPGVQDLLSQRQGNVSLLQAEVERVLGDVPAQVDLDETALLTEGQLSEIELGLVSNLVQATVDLQSIRARRSGLDQAANQLRTELAKYPSLIAEYDRIQPEAQIQQQSLEQLLQLRQELSNELAQGGFSWDIVEPSQLGEKISPQPKQNIMLGVVAGVFLGGALAFGREAIDTVVRTSDELKKQVALPLLGVIPEIPTRKADALLSMLDSERVPNDSLSISQSQPFRDAVDLIYKTIQLTHSQPLSSLLVTSALVEEGKTTLSIGLALSAARSHQRVLLIDANFRNPSLHQYLGLLNIQGLSTQLHPNLSQWNKTKISPVSLSYSGTSVDVLLAGAVPEDPMSLLSSRQMRQVLEKAEKTYDLVIVDAPAISGLADGLQLASMCDASILVSRLDRITQTDLTHTMAMLDQVNTIGIVANGHRENHRSMRLYERNGSSKISKEPAMLWRS